VKRNVFIRRVGCLGIAIPIDDSCDKKIQLKDSIPVYSRRDPRGGKVCISTVNSSSEGTNDNPEKDTSDEDEPLSEDLPPSTHTATASGSVLLESPTDGSDGGAPPKTGMRGNPRGHQRGRGCTSQRSRGHSSKIPGFLVLCT